jgi:hypothetical protein
LVLLTSVFAPLQVFLQFCFWCCSVVFVADQLVVFDADQLLMFIHFGATHFSFAPRAFVLVHSPSQWALAVSQGNGGP